MKIKRRRPPFVLCGLVLGFAILIFIENFVASSRFAFMSLRHVDDWAFQNVLEKYHHINGVDLLNMNDFGYGWIYWFVLSVITYPADILFHATGIAWPLIVLPRMMSLLFSVLCSCLCYKIISQYTENEWIKAAVVLLMPLFPAGGHYAGRFSTVSQVAFFSMLSIYYIVRNEVLLAKDLRKALVAYALGMATKVSAVAVAPILILLILSRYNWKFTYANIKVWIRESILAVVIMICAISPVLVVAPLASKQARQSWEILQRYWTSNQGESDFINNLIQSLCRTLPFWLVLVLHVLLILLVSKQIIRCIRRKQVQWDLIWIPVGYIIGIIYLCATIPTGARYVFIYETAFSFFMPFGLLCFDIKNLKDMQNKFFYKCMVTVCLGFCFLQLTHIMVMVGEKKEINILSHYQKAKNSEVSVEQILKIEKQISQLNLEKINIYADYKGPYSAYSKYEHKNVETCIWIWDNLGRALDANVLVLSKSSVGFYSDEKFDIHIKTYSELKKDTAVEDRKIRKNLIKENIFNSELWELIYEDDHSYVYVKQVDLKGNDV